MGKVFTVVCRGSWLSLAQVELFKQKIREVAPEVEIRITIKETTGDRNQEIVLQDLEGKDFFTKDIQDVLLSGAADFAVHSLKDVSGENFFHGNHYAIIDRDDPRDVAIFNADVMRKINANQPLVIGTSSPRRVLMATRFLHEALPTCGGMRPHVQTKPIRGNVDTRLRKLSDGIFDGVILAAAGLNRLLRFDQSRNEVAALLKSKKIMILPLLECPPAPSQGAIVAEARHGNTEAVNLLQKVNQPALTLAAQRERDFAKQYGSGCHQQFGVVHVNSTYGSFTFGAGVFSDQGKSKAFSEYRYEQPHKRPTTILKASEYFFEKQQPLVIDKKKHAIVVDTERVILNSEPDHLWATNSGIWRKLARQGHWVEGSTEEMGSEQTENWRNSPLINISEVEVIQQKKEYGLVEGAEAPFQKADFIFWTDIEQYRACKSLLSATVQHGCLMGVVDRFISEGIRSICFPSIEAFTQWSKN